MVSAPRIVVADYDHRWPERAETSIATVLAASDGSVQRVEHIGSTSIPGMAAKNVIDLQASVSDLDRAADVLDSPLRALGFQRLPYDRDHVPAGSNDDPNVWAKRLFVQRDDPDGAVNLHVRLAGSPNERLALLFRDWFRAHPESVPAYATFKRTLAAEVPDIDGYSDVKDPVVDLVITVAESWATSTGWSATPRGSRA
jgi:GrpB-like predicted nucleotidyltransferase (UPF0157 family)